VLSAALATALLAGVSWGGWSQAPRALVDGAGEHHRALSPVGGAYPWVSDQGDGTYRNPVILGDYSDPDVIRVGPDYFLVSSSFNATPALPILRSRDLVNWTIVGHAMDNLPHPRFAAVEPGGGVWAPAWGRHGAMFYIFFSMPDDGIYVVMAPAPTGPWTQPRMLIAGKGLIDPCGFWDDDGRAYVVHAYARSRSGIKSKLRLVPMALDASRVLGPGEIVFDGTVRQPTIEGPKMYKRNGWYFILAPAGGVPEGWQVALRSRAIWGPYEDRVMLQQGRTDVNGPHQGAWVDTPDGTQSWFVHFQDLGLYGRVVHLNPVRWIDDWPVMGTAADAGDRGGAAATVGEPFLRHAKPRVQSQPGSAPQTSDDFDSPRLGPQWQWNANHNDAWYSTTARPGFLRLFPQALAVSDLALAPNLLLQKFPARAFTAETIVDLAGAAAGTRAGLVVVGKTSSAVVVEPAPTAAGMRVTVTTTIDGQVADVQSLATSVVRLRVFVSDGGISQFSFGPATGPLRQVRKTFQAQPGRWIGARLGVFATMVNATVDGVRPSPDATYPRHGDFSEFRFSAPQSAAP
jgi:beta-xylosidase